MVEPVASKLDGVRGGSQGREGGTMTDGEYRILFMVKARYFDAIVAGTKTFELRRDSQRWYSMGCEALRAGKKGRLAIAVFMCGRQRVPRRRIGGGRGGEKGG